MTLTDVFSYNVSNAATRARAAYRQIIFKIPFNPLQATGVNCSVLSDLAPLKASQTDVRPLHPEDMMQNDMLVSTLLAQQPMTTPASAHLKMSPVWSEL